MKFDFVLNSVTVELSEPKNVLWIPAIPARELKAYKGRRINITETYLRSAASETKRFYSDLESRGVDYKRPILCAHDDSGRRSGTLLDFAVRDYKGAATLFVKGSFLAESYNAILNGSLAHGSISIVPEYTDPESGETYKPFIKEWSETHSPVVKGFTVSELHETPSQLAALNLTLSEDNMTDEQMEKLFGDIKVAISGEIATALEPITKRLDALDGGEKEEDENPEEEASEPAEAPEAPEAVAASEAANVIDFAAFNERFDRIEKRMDLSERVRAKGSQKSSPATPGVGAKKKKKPVTLAEIKKESGLHGLAAVVAQQEANNV